MSEDIRKLIRQCTKEVNSWPQWKRDQLKDLISDNSYEPEDQRYSYWPPTRKEEKPNAESGGEV